MAQKKITIAIILFVSLSFVFPLLGGETIKLADSTFVDLGTTLRSYYLNDQRIQWSGLEATFGVEGAVAIGFRRELSRGSLHVDAEFFLNQPFDRNILVDAERARYLQNFEIETFEVAQIFLNYKSGEFAIGMGKRESNFGRNYSLPLSNAYTFQPFIRTEAILRHETGLFISYSPGVLDLSLAVVNGSTGMDTNSSKAGIIRLGLKGDTWAVGISAKAQDGIGSEQQKQFNNHLGFDWMFQSGPFRFFGEVIYDQYGFRKPFDPDNVFWPRSLYYRDIYLDYEEAVIGKGGYVALQYETPRWLIELNLGHYLPEEIGHVYHDDPITRGIIKLRLNLSSRFHLLVAGLFEKERTTELLFKGASPYMYFVGLQYIL